MITPVALELIGDAVLRHCDLLYGLEAGVLENAPPRALPSFLDSVNGTAR